MNFLQIDCEWFALIALFAWDSSGVFFVFFHYLICVLVSLSMGEKLVLFGEMCSRIMQVLLGVLDGTLHTIDITALRQSSNDAST